MTEHKEDKVETLCLNCIFAEWEINTYGNKEQVGCSAKILTKFDYEECIDDKTKTEFYAIPGRVCLYNRSEAWAKTHTSMEDLVLKARQEITLRLTTVVYMGENHTEDDLINTIKSLVQNKLQPCYIIFIFNDVKLAPSYLMPLLAKHLSDSHIQFRMEFIQERGASTFRCIDICTKKVETTFFAWFNAGFIVQPNFISNLDIALNDNLERFLVLTGDENYNGLVIQRLIARQIGGSIGERNLLEKLKHIMEAQECQHLIKPVSTYNYQ